MDAPGVYYVTLTVHNIGSGSCPAEVILSDPQPARISLNGPLVITEPGTTGNWS
jgi:hypothetical protein